MLEEILCCLNKPEITPDNIKTVDFWLSNEEAELIAGYVGFSGEKKYLFKFREFLFICHSETIDNKIIWHNIKSYQRGYIF